MPIGKIPNTAVVWITGLSGAGKSTLSINIVKRLRSENSHVIYLDGDELRGVFGSVDPSDINHGKSARLKLALQYSALCKLLSDQGFIVVIATISMFSEVHDWNRKNLKEYFEVYLKVPIDELRRRDPKKIYERFDRGELQNVAGLDLLVDEPANSNLVLNYDPDCSVDQMSEKIITMLKRN